MTGRNPIEDLAHLRHEFGEHGGVNMSIEASSTFTVIDPETMPDLFQGRAGPDKGCYLYGRHFNPTVFNLGRQMAALVKPFRLAFNSFFSKSFVFSGVITLPPASILSSISTTCR